MSGTFTDRVRLTIGGVRYTSWQRMKLTRDLRDITGHFAFGYYDEGRAGAAYPASAAPAMPAPVPRRAPVTIDLDGERVFDGYLFMNRGENSARKVEAEISGRDRTGDLADCSACPTGPAEWRNAPLLTIAQAICAPFNIRVSAQTDLGAPFRRLAINAPETALSTLEKAARQRGALMVSDGVGGLLFTTGGRERAPGDLIVGQNAQLARWEFNDERRYSDIWIKGQSEKAAGSRPPGAPSLGHNYSPAPWSIAANAGKVESAGILMSGHATDPEITRFRPSVRFTRTQSGGATQQQQAEWAVRVARGTSNVLAYWVPDWRVNGVLWRPNEVAHVYDAYAGIDDDMLIRSVSFEIGPDGKSPNGPFTQVEVVGLTAFDRVDRKATHVRLHQHLGNA